jgi:hypothetical protein
MRLTLLPFLLIVSTISLSAQKQSEWSRVYTLDEAIVEMNTTLVTRISEDITRVRFRWTFHQPQVGSGKPQLEYKSRLEVMEFNCAKREYRPYHFTYFDALGNTMRIDEKPREWRRAYVMDLTGKLLESACNLIAKKPIVQSTEAIVLEKAMKFAVAFTSELNQTKDFKPVIRKFFAPNYLDGYLRDKKTNWFHNLNRTTAAQVSRTELERFYVALLNAGYLTSLYLISEIPPDSAEPISSDKVLPPDVMRLISNHPYSRAYRNKEGSYDYLGENVDTIQRLRSYIDLLEHISALMRKHVIRVRAERSEEYMELRTDIYQPSVRSCQSVCLGFPKGTKLYDVKVPVLHLQLTEIEGRLKIVSATNSF